MKPRVTTAAAATMGLVAPFVISLAWVPIRTQLPDADLALVLVAVVVAVGAFGRRLPVGLGAVSAAFSFVLFDTEPFERLTIARFPDIVTTVVLVCVAAAGGELAVRAVRHRSWARSERARFTSIGEAASLLASGEELVLVIETVGQQLAALLGLEDWTFGAGDGDPGLPAVERSGVIAAQVPAASDPVVSPIPAAASGPPPRVVLPIWGHRQVLGHFQLEFRLAAKPPSQADLLVAVTLADQVGAAFMAQAPPPPDPSTCPAPNLRVVR